MPFLISAADQLAIICLDADALSYEVDVRAAGNMHFGTQRFAQRRPILANGWTIQVMGSGAQHTLPALLFDKPVALQ